MAKTKMVVFDMDGTLADLYGVPEWLAKLSASDCSPYEEAAPMCDFSLMRELLADLREFGVVTSVISWNSRSGDSDYHRRVRRAKLHWLKRHGLTFDYFHVVKYGTPKHQIAKRDFNDVDIIATLFDDDENVRDAWTLGAAINPETENINDALYNLLCELRKGDNAKW